MELSAQLVLVERHREVMTRVKWVMRYLRLI
jgi:hypothetical protein